MLRRWSIWVVAAIGLAAGTVLCAGLALVNSGSDDTSLPATSSTTEASSTTSAPTTTTTAAPSTTTPPPSTTSPRRPAPTDPPATEPPATSPPESPATTEPAPSAGPCADALVGIRAVGLPPGFSVYCSAEKTQGHAGLTGWNYQGESFVAINPATGNHPGVGAHEACHAQDFATKGASSEASADACARAHGYPNPYEHADDTLVGEKPASGPLLWLQLSVLVGVLVLIGAVLSLLPAVRRRLTHHHHRKDSR